MVTSIVRKVQRLLAASGRTDVEVEIVFPVSPDAITTAGQEAPAHGPTPTLPGGLAVIPGAASGALLTLNRRRLSALLLEWLSCRYLKCTRVFAVKKWGAA